MKKLLLLVTSALVVHVANAQYAQTVNMVSSGDKSAKAPVMPYQVKPGQNHTWGKSSAGGSRWYSHVDIINELMGGQSSSFDWSLIPIWFDSTVRQNFTTGLGTINYSSVGQVLDPIYFSYNTDLSLFSPTTIAVSPGDAYTVDSVYFSGAYVKNLNRPSTIVDTFILSVSPTTSTGSFTYYPVGQTVNPWIHTNGYVPIGDTMLRGFTVAPVDGVNRASGVPGAVVWKVPLFDGDRQQDSAGFVDIQSFTFPVMVQGVPGSVSIPAGSGIDVTVTFKSGDVVPIPNVDTFSEYHHFSAYTGAAQGANQAMPYYFPTNDDRNMSQLMFSTDTTYYAPTIMIEGWNAISFGREFHDIAAHLVCGTCSPVSVTNVNTEVISGCIAYPNPASNEVNISFTAKENTNATVSVTNAIGQVVATQTVSNTQANVKSTATFNTATLPAGMYLYTVEAGGQRSSDRFVVSH